MFKAVILDLDGTLLNSNKQVTPNTAKVLQHLHHNYNVEIVLCSGRAPRLIFPYADDLGVNCYVIGYNGAQGWSKKDENGERKILFTDPLPTEALSSIFNFVTDKDLPLNVYLDFVYAIDTAHLRPFTEHYSKLTGATYKYVPSYSELAHTEPAKSIILTENEPFCDSLMIEAAETFPFLSVVKSNCHSHELSQYYVEFLQKGVDKGTAVQKWCNTIGITTTEVLAFGDAENDLNMLKVVKFGFCMAQGVKAVKEIAYAVTEFNNDQDGVGHELQKIYELNLI